MRRIILTASGGAFRDWDVDRLASVTGMRLPCLQSRPCRVSTADLHVQQFPAMLHLQVQRQTYVRWCIRHAYNEFLILIPWSTGHLACTCAPACMPVRWRTR